MMIEYIDNLNEPKTETINDSSHGNEGYEQVDVDMEDVEDEDEDDEDDEELKS